MPRRTWLKKKSNCCRRKRTGCGLPSCAFAVSLLCPPPGENSRVWVYSSVTSAQNNAVSKVVDKAFDDAYNQTVIAGDLPNVRWARIDYMNVTYLKTKWNVWT